MSRDQTSSGRSQDGRPHVEPAKEARVYRPGDPQEHRYNSRAARAQERTRVES